MFADDVRRVGSGTGGVGGSGDGGGEKKGGRPRAQERRMDKWEISNPTTTRPKPSPESPRLFTTLIISITSGRAPLWTSIPTPSDLYDIVLESMGITKVEEGSVVGGMLIGRIRELASADGDFGNLGMSENVERVQVIEGLTLRPTGSPSITPQPSPKPTEFLTSLSNTNAVTNPPYTKKVMIQVLDNTHPPKLWRRSGIQYHCPVTRHNVPLANTMLIPP